MTSDKSLEITRLEDEILRINRDALRSVFIRPGLKDKKFAIISIGKMKTGKSFLMKVVLRYLRRHGATQRVNSLSTLEWENDNWMGDENYADEADGTERRTTGIHIFDELFEVPVSTTETMFVMLMDTQGLFDNDAPEIVNKSLLTLTTLMSSALIFNFKENIDTQTLEYLKTCLNFALRTAKASAKKRDDSEGYLRLQNLMFLVRDFPDDDEDEIYGLEIGNKYLENILTSNKGGEELIRIRSHIRDSFDKVECFAMPHPGMKATKKNFLARNKDIEDYFRVYAKHFVEHVLNPSNIVPKRPNTKRITSREMLNMIAACDTLFAEKMINAETMMKMSEKAYYSSLCQAAIMEYDQKMKQCTSDSCNVQVLEQKHKNAMKVGQDKLKAAEFMGDDDTQNWKEHFYQHFEEMCVEHFGILKREYKVNLERKRLTMRTATHDYESRMTRGFFKPLSEQDFEKIHAKHQRAVVEMYKKFVDEKTLRSQMLDVYNSLKTENKQNREAEELDRMNEKAYYSSLYQEYDKKKKIERVSKISTNMWKMTLTTCLDDSVMERKKEEIFEVISTTFLDSTESVEEEELKAALDKQYQEAKRQNKSNWENKRLKHELALTAIQKYETLMKKELPEPVTDAALEEVHVRHQNLICEAYANIADEETLTLGLTESYKIMKLENRQKSMPAKILRSTNEFYDEHLNDDTVYRFSRYSCKGKVLIINNNFDGDCEWERPGSEVDVQNLKTLWKDLGFHVYTKHNLTAIEMRAICEEFAQNTGILSAVVVTIMSHGKKINNVEYIYGNDKQRVRTEDLIFSFAAQNCPLLQGVPKVFMFQACRGRRCDGDRADSAPEVEPIRRRTPERADMLIVHPSQSGYVAYRHVQRGSSLINAVVKVFTRHAHKKDVLAMLTMVNNEVSTIDRPNRDVQMSNQETYLRKTLYLFPGFPS